MSDAPQNTVWFDAERAHYYALPDHVLFPEGALFLRSSRGGHRTIDPASVADYEISKEDAVARMRDEMGAAVGRMKDAFSGLFRLPGNKAGAASEGERLVSQFGKVVGAAIGAAQEAFTNPAAADDAGQRIEQVKASLAEERERLEPGLHTLGEKLQQAMTAPPVEKALQNLSSSLQELAKAVHKAREEQGEKPAAGDADASATDPSAQDPRP